MAPQQMKKIHQAACRFLMIVIFQGMADVGPDNPPSSIHLTNGNFVAPLCCWAHDIAYTAFETKYRMHDRDFNSGAVFVSKHDSGHTISKLFAFDPDDAMEEVHDYRSAIYICLDNRSFVAGVRF
ncbi:MAG TPA: hypothetical protein DDW73_04825, partial [Rhizobium sp.]|nr:hypothetical protein [Rhizobium sp.]